MTASELYDISQLWFPPPPSPAVAWNDLREVPSSSGVYFLYKSGRAVYVGESIDIRRRLRSHEHKGKYEAISWIKCDPSSRKRLESFYIAVLDPFLNSNSTSSTSKSKSIATYIRGSNLLRRVFAFVCSSPGCTKTQIVRSAGRIRPKRNKEQLDALLLRMCEWKIVVAIKQNTSGRPRTVYFPAKTPDHSDSLNAEV